MYNHNRLERSGATPQWMERRLSDFENGLTRDNEDQLRVFRDDYLKAAKFMKEVEESKYWFIERIIRQHDDLSFSDFEQQVATMASRKMWPTDDDDPSQSEMDSRITRTIAIRDRNRAVYRTSDLELGPFVRRELNALRFEDLAGPDPLPREKRTRVTGERLQTSVNITCRHQRLIDHLDLNLSAFVDQRLRKYAARQEA